MPSLVLYHLLENCIYKGNNRERKREKLERINHILHHKKFHIWNEENKKMEQERIFCLHNVEHYFDVARIAYIKALEEEISISKDILYATALLHDIGKHRQYQEGLPHEEESAMMSEEILIDCGYEKEERKEIQQAIRNHRRKPDINSTALERLLYEADKQSRLCLFCKAKAQCKWSDEKKNLTLQY